MIAAGFSLQHSHFTTVQKNYNLQFLRRACEHEGATQFPTDLPGFSRELGRLATVEFIHLNIAGSEAVIPVEGIHSWRMSVA